MWQERWERMDPLQVLLMKEGRRKPGIESFEGRMTQDQSDDIEALLEEWYGWAKAQREHLGYSRVSPMFRQADSSGVYDDGFDVDNRLHKVTAEMVDSCLSELAVMERAAIDVHLRNKVASVHRNPRLGTVEQQHRAYLDAKEKLFPIFKRKGLVS